MSLKTSRGPRGAVAYFASITKTLHRESTKTMSGIAQVFQEMPTISHLSGLGRSLFSALGIVAGTTAADDGDFRMVFQPGRERLAGAVREKIQRAASFQIADDRAVGVSPAKRPIIHTYDLRSGLFRQRPSGANPVHPPVRPPKRVRPSKSPRRPTWPGFSSKVSRSWKGWNKGLWAN